MHYLKNIFNISYKFKRKLLFSNTLQRNLASDYVQGQTIDNKGREYFYFVDHQGMLFLDDAKIKNFTSCIKEKKFLAFFFSRLKINSTERYPTFPFISLCGREVNYVRCDDLPFVFTHIADNYIYFNHAGDLLKKEFLPQKVRMNTDNGRVYHPADERIGGVGLVKSSLAIELSSKFIFANGEKNAPTHLLWENKNYTLEN